jgi:SAM-dependent methyltransferase
MAGGIDAPGVEILDVGCGNGELLKCLAMHGFRGKYRGIDIHAGQIDEARGRFPGVDFSVCNILEDKIAQADIVMMSGLFNVDCGQDMEFVQRFIGSCCALARERFVFNAITSYVSRRDFGMFYVAPEAAIGIAARRSQRFELRHGFLPFNFTMCIHMNESSPKSLP